MAVTLTPHPDLGLLVLKYTGVFDLRTGQQVLEVMQSDPAYAVCSKLFIDLSAVSAIDITDQEREVIKAQLFQLMQANPTYLSIYSVTNLGWSLATRMRDIWGMFGNVIAMASRDLSDHDVFLGLDRDSLKSLLT